MRIEMLLTKYRPQTFEDFIGNSVPVKALKRVIDSGNIPKAFLISGDSGCGKTTLARLIKKAVKCDDASFVELNGSSERGIDTIRNIVSSIAYAPIAGKSKVIFIDEAHQLTKEAQEALLKSTEDPPPDTYWIFCTTEPQNIRAALSRRLFKVNLPPLKNDEMLALLKVVIKGEGLDKSKYSKHVVAKSCQLAGGSAGRLLQIFESIYLLESEEEMLAQLTSFDAGEETGSDSLWIPICRILVKTGVAPSAKWKEINKYLSKITLTDYEPGRRVTMAYLSTVLLRTGLPIYANMLEHFTVYNPASSKAQYILACYKSCLEH